MPLQAVPSPLRERVRVRGFLQSDALTPALSHRERENTTPLITINLPYLWRVL